MSSSRSSAPWKMLNAYITFENVVDADIWAPSLAVKNVGVAMKFDEMVPFITAPSWDFFF